MGDRVLVIVPVYRQIPVVLASLAVQSHREFEVRLIHDGPDIDHLERFVDVLRDSRFHFEETPVRHGCWGHAVREYGIKRYGLRGDFILHTNADCYLLPRYLETMVGPLLGSALLVATYCDFLHRTLSPRRLDAALVQGRIDCGATLVRAGASRKVGWPERRYEADWDYVSALIAEHSEAAFHHVQEALFVHN